jgi:hypothetical protein
LDKKSQRIVKKKLNILIRSPYARQIGGDKENLGIKVGFNHGKYDYHRIHLGRTYTAFYIIVEKEKLVMVTDLMTIEKAHKLYGRL